jgi:hypothetical protein
MPGKGKAHRMTNENKPEKPKPDRKKYLIGQYIGNLIGAVIVTASLAWVVFGLFEEDKGNELEVQAFMLVFVSCFMLIQCHTALVNTRKDFIKGKWVMGDEPPSVEPDSIINPWRRMVWLALPLGMVTALVACMAVPLLGKGPYSLLTIDIIAFAALFPVSTIIIGKILPLDQASFTTALEKPKPENPLPFTRYFLIEYVGPWIVLQGLINFGIGVKQFIHETEIHPDAVAGGGVPASLMAMDFGIVFGIIVFFMFLASDGQVRLDVRLGRVAGRTFKRRRLGEAGVPLIALVVVLATAAIMAAVGAMATVAFLVTGVESFSVISAAVLKAFAAVLGCLAGCGLGVWWGTRRETSLIQDEAQES